MNNKMNRPELDQILTILAGQLADIWALVQRSGLLRHFPELLSHFCHGQLILSDQVEYAAVLGDPQKWYLVVNPTILDKPEYLAGIMAHELNHLLLGHCWGTIKERGKNMRYKELWSRAKECVTNSFVPAWLSLPAVPVRGDLPDTQLQKWSSEAYYRYLLAQKRRKREAPGEGTEGEFESASWNAIREARKIIGRCRDQGGEGLAKVKPAPGLGIEWRKVLRMMSDKRTTSGRSLLWPHSHYPTMVGRVPGRITAPEASCLAVIIDTSNSMSMRMLGRIIGELEVLLSIYPGTVVLIEADDRVRRVSYLGLGRRGRRLRMDSTGAIKLIGRGGTDFRPGIAEAEKHHAPLTVIFSDGNGTMPMTRPQTKLVWILTQERKVAFAAFKQVTRRHRLNASANSK